MSKQWHGGKGDSNRTSRFSQYQNNYDKIFKKPMQNNAEIIADSLHPNGSRLTTFVLRFPRIVLAEFNTHRAISRNSASSRAIPFDKMLDNVKNDPFIPFKFQKDHKGMQGTEYFEGTEHDKCVEDWLKARDAAVEAATSFSNPVTKQLRNRLLEPFLWHTVIATATDWENFFALRAHEAAEIHIQDLAYKMLNAYNSSDPKKLAINEWHIPFGDRLDEDRIKAMGGTLEVGASENLKIEIATARCARVSYLNFEGKDDYEADVKLFNRLKSMGHMSPFEHCAMAFYGRDYSGNFTYGWLQLRKTIDNENKKDPRIL